MSEKNFRKSLKVPNPTNTPATDKRYEHSIKDKISLIHRVNSDRKILDRLNDYLISIADFCEKNRPNLSVNIIGRIKSIKKAVDNLVKKEKNIDDLIGFKIIVQDVKTDYSPEIKLKAAINALNSIRKTNNESAKFIKRLTNILDKKEKLQSAKSLKANYRWSDFYKSEPEGERLQYYKNIDVLFVDRLSKEINALTNSSSIPKTTVDKVINYIREAQSATTYGASIELTNYIKDKFVYEFSECSVIEDRSKSVLKENGYAAEHFTLRDNKLNISIEVQCKSNDNEEIAKFGAAAHQLQDGKDRFLQKFSQTRNTSIPINTHRENLLSFFNEDFVQSIRDTLPQYTSIVTENGVNNYKTFTGWENFCYYYKEELQKMTVKEKEYYEVFLSIEPYFDNQRDNFRTDFPFDRTTLNVLKGKREKKLKQQQDVGNPGAKGDFIEM